MQLKPPLEAYEFDLNENGFEHDPSQRNAVQHLQDLHDRLIRAGEARRTFLARVVSWFSKRECKPERGLYLWGGVGRGKTYLMDLFFESLPFEQKLRTHFHRFMRHTHHELKRVKSHKDPLDLVADTFASKYRVICFDEFFVVDITDAMILAKLLEGLFRRGVTLVATSNIEPGGLYKDGLQRARFIPAIGLLEKHTRVINLDGGVDYRLRALKQSDMYYAPDDERAEQALEAMFTSLVHDTGRVRHGGEIEIEGRGIPVKRRSDGLIWCDFAALCDGPRSQNDYIEIAREHHTVIVSGVPVFRESNDDQARRFIYLVDEFYDRRVKLALSAEASYHQLYLNGRLAFEFERTRSRLQEMQSEEYLATAHRA